MARWRTLAVAALLLVAFAAVSAEEDAGATAALKKKVSQLEADLKKAQAAAEDGMKQAADFKDKLKAAEAKLKATEDKLKAASAMMAEAQQKAKALEKERDASKAKAAEFESQVSKLKATERELDSTKVELEDALSQLDELKTRLHNTWINLDAVLPESVSAQVNAAWTAAAPHARAASDAAWRAYDSASTTASELWATHGPLVRSHSKKVYYAGVEYSGIAAAKLQELCAELMKNDQVRNVVEQASTTMTEIEDLALVQMKAVPALAPYAERRNVRIGLYAVALGLPMLLILPCLASRKKKTAAAQPSAADKRRSSNGTTTKAGGGFRAPSPDAMNEIRRSGHKKRSS